MLVTALAVLPLSPVYTIEHIVRKGETLYSIGRNYTVSVDDLCGANGLKKTDTIKEGQRLFIPGTEENTQRPTELYTVKAEDTLYGIARKFDMQVEELKRMNNLASDKIKVGQKLAVAGQPEPIIPTIDFNIPDARTQTGKKADSTLVWPVKTSSVVYVTGKISGVQLEAQKDETVTSISSGIVMFSGAYRGFGQVVFVQNTNGYVYVYTGLSSLAVQKGDSVRPGAALGKTGVDALSGKSRLTFMVYRDGKPLDPALAPRG